MPSLLRNRKPSLN